MRMLPDVGVNAPVARRSSVVLPLPFEPLSAMRSGPVMFRDRFRITALIAWPACEIVDLENRAASRQPRGFERDAEGLQDLDLGAGFGQIGGGLGALAVG